MLPSLFDEVFIIGGSQVYEIFAPYITEWYITRITNSQLCDAFLKVDLKNFEEVSREQIIDANQKVSFYVFRKQMEEP
jgi:dihydrofolate reductase (trimethoprim resistance protein)